MSWLVRMELDAPIAYQIKALDNYGWHQRLWDCFPGTPAATRDFLTRVDELAGKYRIWILAERQPVRPNWCPSECFGIKEIATHFFEHRYFHFDLKANPTKCISKRDPDGKMPRHGKRVPLVKPEHLEIWLADKGKDGGFHVIETKPLEIGPAVQLHFRQKSRAGYHSGVQFRGTLEVTDPHRFAKVYRQGIGGAKGFGFGMLLLAPTQL